MVRQLSKEDPPNVQQQRALYGHRDQQSSELRAGYRNEEKQQALAVGQS